MSLSRRVVAYVLVQHASRLESLEHLPTGTTPCPHGTAHPQPATHPKGSAMPDWKKWLSCCFASSLTWKIQLCGSTGWPHGMFSRRFHGEALIKHIVTFQRQSCGSNRSWRQSMIINISFCWLVQPIWREEKHLKVSKSKWVHLRSIFFRLSKIANLWNHRLLMHLETFWNHLGSQRTAWPG